MKISKNKRDKIKEAILSFLFQNSPNSYFTAEIAEEIARDEEFTKALLEELERKNFVTLVRKNIRGISYERRLRWRISSKIYDTYRDLQGIGVQAY